MVINRYKTQSFSVSEEELEVWKSLADLKRMKPATLVRALCYRGLREFLLDGEVFSTETDEEIYTRLVEYLESRKSDSSKSSGSDIRKDMKEFLDRRYETADDEQRKIIERFQKALDRSDKSNKANSNS